MLSIPVKRLDPRVPLPTGNPFPVHVSSYRRESRDIGNLAVIETGLVLSFSGDIALDIHPVRDFGFIVGYRHGDRGLEVLVCGVPERLLVGEHFAQARVVDLKSVSCRFLNVTAEGKRIITGEPQKVEDSTQTGSPES